MSDQITTFNYETYSQGIEMLAQQMSSMTRSAVREEAMSGKRVFFDQVGAVRMQPKIGRAVDIPVVETPHARRSITAKDFYMRDFVDEFDKLKILNDPTNAYSSVFAGAAARELDKVVIDAAIGNAFTGEEGTTSVALPGAQTIVHGGTGFTLDKIQEGVEKLRTANAVGPGDSIHLFYTAKTEKQFINTNEVKNSDFNNKKVMVDGELRSFYGVNFHRIEDMPDGETILPKAGNVRSCVMLLRSGVVLGTWKSPYGRVAWLDERESFQVMAGMSIGATRMQEVKVVVIEADETA